MSKAKPKKNIIRSITEFVIVVAAALVLAFLVTHFVVQPYEIPSGSMEDTIAVKDRVLSEKISYMGDNEPQVGDIVTFVDVEDNSRVLIKRVIATEGQVVDIKDGSLYIDGEKKTEDYVDGKPTEPIESAKSITYPYTVPEGCIWVMGDNRTNSLDSRYFGAVPVENVTGHAFFTYWPISSIGRLE